MDGARECAIPPGQTRDPLWKSLLRRICILYSFLPHYHFWGLPLPIFPVYWCDMRRPHKKYKSILPKVINLWRIKKHDEDRYLQLLWRTARQVFTKPFHSNSIARQIVFIWQHTTGDAAMESEQQEANRLWLTCFTWFVLAHICAATIVYSLNLLYPINQQNLCWYSIAALILFIIGEWLTRMHIVVVEL